MIVTLLVWLGSIALASFAVAVAVLSLLERRALERFAAATETDVEEILASLSPPLRLVASDLVERLQRLDEPDEALVLAMVRAVSTEYGPSRVLGGLGHAGLVLVLLAPASVSLFGAARSIAGTWEKAKEAGRPALFLEGQVRMDAAFESVHGALTASAWLLAGLVLAWAVAWWLRRPEAREALLVRALVLATGSLRSSASLVASRRMASLIALDRGLAQPALAAVFWVIAVTAGWLVLNGTAEVKAENARAAVFDVWPEGLRRPVESKSVVLPRLRAGSPLAPRPLPTLFIHEDGALLGSFPLVSFEAGALPKGWAKRAPDMARNLAGFERPLELLVLSDGRVSVYTVAEVLDVLARSYSVERFHLVVERAVRIGRETRSLQAALPLQLVAEEAPSGAVVAIEGDAVILDGGTRLLYADPAWAGVLGERIRQKSELWGGGRPLRIVMAEDLRYAQLIEVLAAADTVCRGEEDCGLPGLGLAFAIVAPESPPSGEVKRPRSASSP